VGDALLSFVTDLSPETSPSSQNASVEQRLSATPLSRSATSSTPSPHTQSSSVAQKFLSQLELVYKNAVQYGTFTDLAVMIEKVGLCSCAVATLRR